jgi:hypothetical protein
VILDWYGFEYDISANGSKGGVLGKPITFSDGFGTSLEAPHFVVEAFVR